MDETASSSRLAKTQPPQVGAEPWDDGRIEVIGRYTLHSRIGNGGMAAVHLGWLTGAADFSRIVAIKRLHPQFALDENFAARFRDEARLYSRLSHPGIVQVLDVVEKSRELLIVMEYVHGVSVSGILGDARTADCTLPPAVVAAILVPALQGLHAAHEVADDEGRSIGIVHRDFSPQNIMVSSAGHAKVVDFGIAKARTHAHITSSGQLAGKYGYLAPEQALGAPTDRRADVFAAGIVAWEMLVGRRLFLTPGTSEIGAIQHVLHQTIRPPSSANPLVPGRIDEVVLHALERDPQRRFASARELALELEAAAGLANTATVAEWVERTSAPRLASLSRQLECTRRCLRQAQLSVAARMDNEATTRSATVLAKPAGKASSRPRTTRRAVFFAVGVAVLAFVLGVSFRQRWFASSGAASTVAGTTSTPVADKTAAVHPETRPNAGVLPMADLQRPPEDTKDVAAEPVRRPEARIVGRAVKGRTHSATRHPRTAGTKEPVRPNCDPPTYLDPDGIRIYKSECL